MKVPPGESGNVDHCTEINSISLENAISLVYYIWALQQRDMSLSIAVTVERVRLESDLFKLPISGGRCEIVFAAVALQR